MNGWLGWKSVNATGNFEQAIWNQHSRTDWAENKCRFDGEKARCSFSPYSWPWLWAREMVSRAAGIGYSASQAPWRLLSGFQLPEVYNWTFFDILNKTYSRSLSILKLWNGEDTWTLLFQSSKIIGHWRWHVEGTMWGWSMTLIDALLQWIGTAHAQTSLLHILELQGHMGIDTIIVRSFLSSRPSRMTCWGENVGMVQDINSYALVQWTRTAHAQTIVNENDLVIQRSSPSLWPAW